MKSYKLSCIALFINAENVHRIFIKYPFK